MNYLLKQNLTFIEFNNKFSILWIIEFYLKEQIKNDIDKNIFIAITLEGYVIIYLFNFLIDLKKKKRKKKRDKNEIYKVIKTKKVDIFQPQTISRLEKAFDYNNKNNNYFLLYSPMRDTAIIINVTSDYKSISLIQKINFTKGLISSILFNYFDQTFLLNPDKYFSLWYFNKKENIMEYKIIEPKYEKYKKIERDKFVHRPIIYIENRKLFIVQIISPFKCIEFYEIDSENKEFNIKIIGRIILKEEVNNFSNSFNNSCIIKDKFLLIGSREKTKNNKKEEGGIFIINLDNIQLIKYIKITHCNVINSLLTIKDNIFVCTAIFGNNKIIDENKKMKIEKNIN